MLETIGILLVIVIYIIGLSLVLYKENVAFRAVEGLGLGLVSAHFFAASN
jgi:hypothetical protein